MQAVKRPRTLCLRTRRRRRAKRRLAPEATDETTQAIVKAVERSRFRTERNSAQGEQAESIMQTPAALVRRINLKKVYNRNVVPTI